MKLRLPKSITQIFLLMAYVFSALSIPAFAAEFPDVSKDHKNYSAVTNLVDLGVIAGYDDGYFRPEREITRTEFCALMARTLGYDKESYVPQEDLFVDVPVGYWGEAYISFCFEKGLVNGMGDGEFWPAHKVTLAQAAKMAVCAIGKEEEALALDVEKWYDGYMSIAEEEGLLDFVEGKADEAAIRGDIAQVVFNMTETGFLDENSESEDDFSDEESDENGAEDEDEGDSISPEILKAYKEKDFSEVKTILIDAGHNYSGKDIGAENKEFDLREEVITWNIADKLRYKLERMGYNVVMTREKVTDSIANTSVLESLQARVDLGHEMRADLFISIHCNAGGGSGTEVYCFQKGGYAWRLAQLVQGNITDRTSLYDREVKTAAFYVIQNTLMPAILIETGFIDNEKDIAVISSEDGQIQIAEAIASAVAMYDAMPPIEMPVNEVQENEDSEDSEETGASSAGGESS